ncbi:hypothetical protein BJV82DRAFT_509058, partial [Fennellomyces sp. T-0311]
VVSFLLEFSGGTSANDEKVQSDELKVYRNAQKAANLVSDYLDGQHPIRTFCCQYHSKVLYFESLTLVDNQKYIRQHHDQIKVS